MTEFSKALLEHPIAKVPAALERIAIAKRRIQSILDTQGVAVRRTLEQKICEQGPRDQRVDPHLLGHAIKDLQILNRLAAHYHEETQNTEWYSNPATMPEVIGPKLDVLAPLYREVTSSSFGNLVGDALEVVVYKTLAQINANTPRFSFAGHFNLQAPKNQYGRYLKVQPPRQLQGHVTAKEADFIQFGHDAGPMCIECKNYREWFYPHYEGIKSLIIKAADLNAVPVLIARRLHYSTRTNLLEPAGIIAHESYYQYYPADKADLAQAVRDKNSLGFTDVTAVEDPHGRTIKFFDEILPTINEYMAAKWRANKDDLLAYAYGEINLAQLYNAIGSPAAGNWQEPDDMEPPDYDL